MPEKHCTGPRTREAAALALLLAAALGCMLFYTARKQGYHVDELYTYELTNYPGGFYALEDGYMDSWHPGSFYAGALAPAAGERFDYRIPWNNQKIDVHPPLYYCLVFTACSLFPGLGLPWVGLLPNYLCLLAAGVFVYAAARRLTRAVPSALVLTACWLLSTGVQGMAVFTRMYSLLMLCGAALLYGHLVLWQALAAGRRGRWVYAGLFAATLAGALTQYFYLVFCFFVCGLFGLYLLAQRRWKSLLAYCAAELGGLCAAYLCFPTMRAHIFGGPRGQQAFESFFDLAALGAWGQSLLRILRMLGGQFGGLLLWSAAAVAAAVVLWRRGVRPHAGSNALFVLGLCLACLCYLIVIDKVAPFEADRYYALLYAPLVLAVGTLAARAVGTGPRGRLWALVGLAVLLSAHLRTGVGYLYPMYAPRHAALAETATLPAVVLNGAGYEVAPDLFLAEFAAREAVYQASGEDDLQSLQNAAATRDLADGFVLYGYTCDADELLALARAALPIQNATLLTEVGRCPTYWVTLA